MTKTLDAFLLTQQWRDSTTGIVLDFWWATEQGAVKTTITEQESVFFVPRDQATEAELALAGLRGWRMAEVNLTSWLNQPVNAVYCRSQRCAREAQHTLSNSNIIFWEGDIKPADRYLMERFVTAAAQLHLPDALNKSHFNPAISPSEYRPELRLLSLDIETSMDAKQLYCIGIWTRTERIVFMVGNGGHSDTIVYCADAKSCLIRFLEWFQQYDPDVIIGWSLVQFDLWVLETLCQNHGVAFSLGRDTQPVHWRQEDQDSGRRYVTIPGRVALDGIELLKAANHHYISYALDHVAQMLLGTGKLLHGSQRGKDITDLFLTDKTSLAKYNLRDCELVWNIFIELKLMHFAIERSQLTGLLLDRSGGSVAAFEYSYLPRLHRRGYVAPNLGELESDVVSPGGYVMDSQPGIFDNVLVLDFKSLYPSIIRTFLIDPVGYWLAQHQRLPSEETVPGFNEAVFARQGHILPNIIETLSSARDKAKAEHNAPLSHAIKIIMNSFYGVLGSTGCRFFDPRVCSSITLRGHEIILRSRNWIEQQGYTVIYGDTDSLFVWLQHPEDQGLKTQLECQTIGKQLALNLNSWWRQHLLAEYKLESALEIQFETHYLRFLMPTTRGTDIGTKKRYAGVIEKDGQQQLVFKGLENVRTDWTQLAKDFQLELYRKIFAKEEFMAFVKDTIQSLLRGDQDMKLTYRKRLRRHLHEYVKNVPPHVQAARKLLAREDTQLRRGDWVEYFIGLDGPEPVQCPQSKLDYQHYIDRQLAPVADSILHFSGQTLAELLAPQLQLFDTLSQN